MRTLATATLLALLTACGGGGGGWGTDVAIARVTPATQALTGIAGLPAPRMDWSVAFSGDLNSLNGKDVYIGVAVAGASYDAPSYWIDEAHRTLELSVTGYLPEPAERHTTGDAQIFLCLDVNCATQLGNSPWTVHYTLDVAPGIRFTPPELTIEVPFGELPAVQRVTVDLPTVRTGASLNATSGQYLQVRGVAGATAYDVTAATAPVGTYTASANVDVWVPDPSNPAATAALHASLPITYRVLEDPAHPFVVSPTSRRFDLEITSPYGSHSAWDALTMLQQVPGGSMEIVEARYLAAPAGAAGHPLATSWLTFSNDYQHAFQAAACTGSVTPVCLPPGDYQGSLLVRYHAAGGATAELEVPVQMVIAPTCEGVPRDFQSDTAACGACYNVCNAGFACSAGRCECGVGRTVCGSSCFDLASDSLHCGGCATACQGAQTCVDGSCCPRGLTVCGAACPDLMRDAANCGACGAACQNGEECSGGACACAPGTQACAPQVACLALATDADNCGACGNRCPAGQGCVDGACAPQASFGMLAGDAAHTGFVAELGGPPLTLAWRAPAQVSTAGPPVVEGGRVVVLGAGGLRAYEAANGALIWQRAVGGGWPALVDGQVYVPYSGNWGNTWLRRIDRGTGELTFELPFTSQWDRYWSPIVVGGVLYMNGGTYGGLYGFDVTGGGSRLFFNSSLGQVDQWSPAYADGAVYTYVGGAVRAHDPVTGAVTASRNLSTGGGGLTAPVLADGQGYVVDPMYSGGGLEAFALGTLARIWRVNDTFTWYPAVAGGVVYALSQDAGGSSRLRAIDAATGVPLWATPYQFSGNGAPLVAGGTAYLWTASGTWAVDLATHQATLLTSASGPMAIWNGMLFLNDRTSGDLLAYRLTR